MHVMNLAEQKPPFTGEIRELVGDAVLVERLQELGFIRGEAVTMRGRALFGEPFIVEIRGTSIALRKREAQCILL